MSAWRENIRTAIRDSGKSFDDVAAELEMNPEELEHDLASPAGLAIEDAFRIALAIGAGDTFHEWFGTPDDTDTHS